MKNLSEYNKGVVALILLAFFSVIIGIIVRELNPYFSPLQQIYIRLGIASIFGFFIFKKEISVKNLQAISKKDIILILGRGIAGFLIASPLWVIGFNNAKLPNAVLIDAIPMSSLLGFLILKEHFSIAKFLFLSLSFLGAVLVSIKDFSGIGGIGKGELLIFIAGLFFALRSISRKWHSKKLSDGILTELLLIIGFFSLLILSLIVDKTNPLLNINFKTGFLMLIGGLINIVLVFLINYGFAKVDAVNAGNITLIAIVFGVIFGFLIYHEIPNLREAMGGVLIIIGVIALNHSIKKHEQT